MVRRWCGQRRVNQHHERLVTVHSHQQRGCMEEQESDSSDAAEGNKPTGDTDDSPSALLRDAGEVVEEGPPPPHEGHCIQNAEEANPPGPSGLVLENESLVADDFQWVVSFLAYSADREFGLPGQLWRSEFTR